MLSRKKIKKKLLQLNLKLLSHICRFLGKQPVHFLHIGKTGGTAIKEALSALRVTDKFMVRFTDRFIIILHSHDVTLEDIPQGDKVFFFVRDPIDRFISGFYSRQREGRPRYRVPWTIGERKAFKLFQTPNQLGKALSSQDTGLRKAAVEAMRSIGHVRNFYRDWLISPSYLLSRKADIIFIGRQEALNEDFALLKKVLGISDLQTQLPSDPVRAHKNPNHLDKDLDPQARNNLEEWYADDYMFLETLLKLRAQIIQSVRG